MTLQDLRYVVTLAETKLLPGSRRHVLSVSQR